MSSEKICSFCKEKNKILIKNKDSSGFICFDCVTEARDMLDDFLAGEDVRWMDSPAGGDLSDDPA